MQDEEAWAERLIHIGAKRLMLNLNGKMQEQIIYVSVGYHHPIPHPQEETLAICENTDGSIR